MKESPCFECLVMPACKAKLLDKHNPQVTFLALDCYMLKRYLGVTRYDHHEKNRQMRIYRTRKVFKLKPILKSNTRRIADV